VCIDPLLDLRQPEQRFGDVLVKILSSGGMSAPAATRS
jgi:hypothetical protein